MKITDERVATVLIWLVNIIFLAGVNIPIVNTKLSQFPFPDTIGSIPFKWFFLVFYSIALFFFISRIKIKSKNVIISLLVFFSLLLSILLNYKLVLAFLALGGYFHYKKKPQWDKILVVFVLFFFIYIPTAASFNQSYYIASHPQPILTPSWWAALNWIKNNTEPCAVIATYWDPGHFITAIARRPVVYDGGTQNSLAQFNKSSVDLGSKAFQDPTMFTIEGNKIIRSRMKDMATMLFTDDEELAYDILKLYRGNCKEMYVLASWDLIGKSQWWSYFATWEPNKATGKKYYYIPLRLSMKKEGENGSVNYVFSLGQNQAIVINEKNLSGQVILTPILKQGPTFAKISKLLYFENGKAVLQKYKNAEVEGMVWLDPSKQSLFFIPKELENSMFTRLFFFHGQGLEHFKFVDNWGGEVKLFRVKFD
ncbi:MAG: hypothetical protein DRN05_02980 [Thermoplasmata archaeon]|nr:MAG: hypothetical protein DRN05_02980 [Thermoplasmata archaeon]